MAELNRRAMLEAGAERALLDVLKRHAEQPATLALTCRALGMMVHGSQRAAKSVYDEGGITALARALRGAAPELLTQAAFAAKQVLAELNKVPRCPV